MSERRSRLADAFFESDGDLMRAERALNGVIVLLDELADAECVASHPTWLAAEFLAKEAAERVDEIRCRFRAATTNVDAEPIDAGRVARLFAAIRDFDDEEVAQLLAEYDAKRKADAEPPAAA